MRLRRGQLGAGWMVVAAAFFAWMGVFVKAGAQHFNSIELLFWRTLIGTVILGAGRWRGLSLSTPHWLGHIKRSFVGYLSMSALFYALTHLPLSTAVTLNYTSSLFFSLICVVKLKDKLSRPAALAWGWVFWALCCCCGQHSVRINGWPAWWVCCLVSVRALPCFRCGSWGRWANHPGGWYSGFCHCQSVWHGVAVGGAGFFPGACQ
jgi:uncharacterized membrane protein